jgi:hypothetical protein
MFLKHDIPQISKIGILFQNDNMIVLRPFQICKKGEQNKNVDEY